MSKLFYGIGRNSGGIYKARVDDNITTVYRTWHNMLARCYSHSFRLKNPTYTDCCVASEWWDFQDFAEWFYNHEYGGFGYDLDKDVMQPCNKIYSSETCCFIPSQLNCLLNDCGSARGDLPQGVNFHKPANKYMARMRVDGKGKYLGLYECPKEAHKVYIIAKEAHVKEKALEWKDRIADDVFQALMSWKFES